ncbi:phospholipase A and acyltransferase 4-like [Littorina saxatilis]|uniref:phospholipase A and acyltransferase 4-like n=1 Tax=Littorina saxatilis TaxID=31220 RepID=UPI0038B57F4E
MGQSHSMEPLNRGDLISIDRGLYRHWAVYIGEERGEKTVVHLTSSKQTGDRAQYREALKEDQKRSKNGQLGGGSILEDICEIKKGTLEVAVSGCSSYQKDNRLDGKYSPRSDQDTVKKAKAWVGKKVNYNLLYFNCEHFAHLCRNGRLVSCQADNWVDPPSLEKTRTIVGDIVCKKIKDDLITDNEVSPTEGWFGWCRIL